ncbi:zinc finger FYVE domain-containing protein 21-like [Rhopilema esculentum]|uniref:zinc finger FYVE domain-containing protein 21-like n=1 Tax=Rhopilema esculentum TaxID=499914 RepID=UPI0031DCEAA1
MEQQFVHGKNRKLERGKGGLRMVAIDEESKSPFEIEEPKWLDDSQHPFCMRCKKMFSFTLRRHHCRRCGRVFCSACCKNKISLPCISYVDPERVCMECLPVAKDENIFFAKDLKVLIEGASFVLNDSSVICECKLHEQSHSKLLFKCLENKDTMAQDSVQLKNITSIENITETVEGSEKVCGKVLKIKEQSETELLKLRVQEGDKVQQKSAEFLHAIQKAMELLFDVQ